MTSRAFLCFAVVLLLSSPAFAAEPPEPAGDPQPVELTGCDLSSFDLVAALFEEEEQAPQCVGRFTDEDPDVDRPFFLDVPNKGPCGIGCDICEGKCPCGYITCTETPTGYGCRVRCYCDPCPV